MAEGVKGRIVCEDMDKALVDVHLHDVPREVILPVFLITSDLLQGAINGYPNLIDVVGISCKNKRKHLLLDGKESKLGYFPNVQVHQLRLSPIDLYYKSLLVNSQSDEGL